MSTQLRKGVLNICVLALINEKDMYGYEVVESISKIMEVKESTIYPILRRLTTEENFDTYMKKSQEGPDRKYYRITEVGKNNLQMMIDQWDEFVNDVNSILKNIERGSCYDKK